MTFLPKLKIKYYLYYIVKNYNTSFKGNQLIKTVASIKYQVKKEKEKLKIMKIVSNISYKVKK